MDVKRPGAGTGRTQSERTQATTGQLIAAAAALFAADGYSATSLDSVAARAGVTKGAVYHHFAGKRELFAAVYEREQLRLAELIAVASRRETDSWDAFYAGCRAFLEASLDPGVQRITLLDAPAALGWQGMRDIEATHSMALLKQGLRAAMKAGRIADRPVEPLAHLLFGATCEAAMLIARSDDQREATRRSLADLKALLDGLALSTESG